MNPTVMQKPTSYAYYIIIYSMISGLYVLFYAFPDFLMKIKNIYFIKKRLQISGICSRLFDPTSQFKNLPVKINK